MNMVCIREMEAEEAGTRHKSLDYISNSQREEKLRLIYMAFLHFSLEFSISFNYKHFRKACKFLRFQDVMMDYQIHSNIQIHFISFYLFISLIFL